MLNRYKNIIYIILLIVGASLIFWGIDKTINNDSNKLSKVEKPRTYKELFYLLNSNAPGIDFNYAETATDDVSKGDYSTTNVQVLGVDEADIVKTDGEYIYSIKGNIIYIVKTNNGNMELISKIEADTGNSNYVEMYISENKLMVIKNEYSNVYYDDVLYDDCIDCEYSLPMYNWSRNGSVSTEIYDISNKNSPKKINELSQSGYYLSSRMVGDYVYVLTNHYVYSDITIEDEKTFVPTLTTNEEKSMEINDILIAPNPTSNTYLVITGLDINNSDDFISSKAILGSSSNIYADLDNIYIAGYLGETIDNKYTAKTSILKFSMNKGNINLDKTGVVDGSILNQFSMDENNGYFRIVTTNDEYTYYEDGDTASISVGEGGTTNSLYILDSNLNIVSSIEDMAKGERVYSVRFDGEFAYVVTYKQVDPLFVMDLSNPSNPKIKSELKIPGFSEYLHVYNDKYLFGLGKEATTEGRVTGLKISMFNIEDKANVTEEYKKNVGSEYSWTEASYNHKAILVSESKNIIGFPVNDYYVVYQFNEDTGFKKLVEISFNLYNGTYYFYGNIRGLYINDILYVINQNEIKTINLKTLDLGNTLELE